MSDIFRNVPSPESEHTVRSSTAAEREEVPNSVIREKEQDDKTDGMDTEGSSTKGDAPEVRRPRNHNGTKRKKKTGVIKNVAEIEALELATEQTLKVCLVVILHAMSSECCITVTCVHFATAITFYQKHTHQGMEGITLPATLMYIHFNCLCLYVYIDHCLHFMYSFLVV